MIRSPLLSLAKSMLFAVLIAGLSRAESNSVRLSVRESRFPTVMQRNNRLWVYWSDATVVDPVLTAHDLPDLKPVWSHRPVTRVRRGSAFGPGISQFLLAGDLLIYWGQADDTTYEYVGLDGQEGEVRFRVPISVSARNVNGQVWANRWLMAGEARVFDVATGAEVAQLPGCDGWNGSFTNDAPLYLTRALDDARATRLRRVLLPSGRPDVDLPLDEVLAEVGKEFAGRSIVAVWHDTVVLELSKSPWKTELHEQRTLAAIDLAEERLIWTTKLPPSAPFVILTHDHQTPILAPQQRNSVYQVPMPLVPIADGIGESVIGIDIKTGQPSFDTRVRSPLSLLRWQLEPTGVVGAWVSDQEKIWAFVPQAGRSGQSRELMCVKLATGELIWRMPCEGMTDGALMAMHDPHDRSDFLVLTDHETAAVFRRDTGERVGAISPQDVGATLRPVARPPQGAVVPKPTPSEQFFVGPWLDRLWILLFAIPLAWLVWRLARQQPVS